MALSSDRGCPRAHRSARGALVLRLGIVGGGQLARMLALAAHPLGVRVQALCAKADESAHRVMPVRVAIGERLVDLRALADDSDVLTFESEDLDAGALRAVCGSKPIFPPLRALELSQDRLLEKHFLRGLGTPLAAFAPVETREDLEGGLATLGLPAVLKTRRGGYDGKGQVVLRDDFDVSHAWTHLGGRPLVLERLVRFERELSLVATRGRTGEVRFYPLVENVHVDGILRATLAPAADVDPRIERLAQDHARRILESLDYVGVLAVEFFEHGDELSVNEFAPRVHNSGHWTIEGAETSQFENHVRAVCGLPLGSTQPRGPSAMLNLLGALPELTALLAIPGAHLHLYDKSEVPGRKLGHVTLCAPDRRMLAERLACALNVIERGDSDLRRRLRLTEWTHSNSSA
ncbi:MAG: 5-(carboxyamino)imidazole ribonucleotide synthase [Planctomycetes bacterium]|nr:5-(carboxyamino)imidazole ribonucleotide synthase [Planctomycetota bacterium]